jgi:hypothetical protein
MTKDNLTDGLVGRFLVFENAEYVDYQDPPSDTTIPESIIDRARHWLEYKTHGGNLASVSGGGNPQAIEADEQAADRLRGHAIEISQKRKAEDPVQAAVWSRHAEKTNKLAMLFAASRYGPGEPWPVIRLDDADKAVRLNNWLTRRMLVRAEGHISKNQVEADVLEVLRIIRETPGISLRDLNRKLRSLKPRDRRDILTSLQESGDIAVKEIPTNGRTKTEFWPI